jgi:NAD(P)-dependent dehydrogenase (short-subunit alcohol dehydrogenase family)
VGTNKKKPTLETTAEDFSFIMATNFEAAYHLCQLAHPLLKESGAGSIVFISSVGGLQSIFCGSVYEASKGILLFTSLLSWANLVTQKEFEFTREGIIIKLSVKLSLFFGRSHKPTY